MQSDKGSAADKLRAALVYLLTCAQLPSGPDMDRLEEALQAAGADLAALAYVRRMRRMKLTGAFELHVNFCTSKSCQELSGKLGIAGPRRLIPWAAGLQVKLVLGLLRLSFCTTCLAASAGSYTPSFTQLALVCRQECREQPGDCRRALSRRLLAGRGAQSPALLGRQDVWPGHRLCHQGCVAMLLRMFRMPPDQSDLDSELDCSELKCEVR